MAETTTPNFGWTMPDPGASANTWGATLNATTQKIDNEVFQNQQGLVPIGSITMFGGVTPPANWLICDGSSLSTAAPYDKLFAVISTTHGGGGGNFNLPNMQGAFPLGAGPGSQMDAALGAAGGAATVTLDDATMMPSHTHAINIGDPQHTHAISDPTHSHTISSPSHTHQVNQVFGGGSEIQSGSGWGQQNVQSGGQTAGITGTNAAATSVSVYNSATGIFASATYTGGDGAHNNMPPYVALNFIIRFA